VGESLLLPVGAEQEDPLAAGDVETVQRRTRGARHGADASATAGRDRDLERSVLDDADRLVLELPTDRVHLRAEEAAEGAAQVEVLLLVRQLDSRVGVRTEVDGDLALRVGVEDDRRRAVVAPPVLAGGEHTGNGDAVGVIETALEVVRALVLEERRNDQVRLEQSGS